MRLAIVTACLAASFASLSQAASLDTRLFGPEADPKLPMACFKATYDKAWLDAHPTQNVTSMTAYVARRVSDGDPNYVWHDANLLIHFRDSKGEYQVTGNCGDVVNGGAGCGVDCDGGSFEFQAVSADQIAVSPGKSLRYYSTGEATEEPVTEGFKFGDTVLTLSRTDVVDCLPLIADEEMKAMVSARATQ